MYSDMYMAYMGLSPKRIPHREYWSCPDAETFLTGIDYWAHPKLCRERMQALYPQLALPIPASDDPVPMPGSELQGDPAPGEGESHHVRWGDGVTWEWDWGHNFRDADEALAFSPLEHPDFTNMPVVACFDYSSEEVLYEHFRKCYPDDLVEGSTLITGTYNTMFMWPLLTFGWELFLEICLDPGFERVMDEFAELNRRLFRAFARLPVRFVECHDDIVNTRGPICSPAWMHKYIYPRYEEFWSIVKDAGKEVLFVSDGRMDTCADDVMACGARGIITEPYTDFKAIARKHENCFLCGEGDVRVLMRNNPVEIEAMVRKMVDTAKITGGYMMSIGNHIPWNTPPEAIKLYLDLSADLAHR